MKLNYRRTLLVGFAFFLICAFWQAYDTVIPIILTARFGMSQTLSGIIMALDNILALFMLPMFGAISDRCKHKMGKRKPFVLVGTVAAIIALMLLTVTDMTQLKMIGDSTKIDDTDALYAVYDQTANLTVSTTEGKKFVPSVKFTREEFGAIRSSISETKISAKKIEGELAAGGKLLLEKDSGKTHFVTYDGTRFWYRDTNTATDTEITPVLNVTDKFGKTTEIDLGKLFRGEKYSQADAFRTGTNSVYTNYVATARQAHIAELTRNTPVHLVFFIIILMVLLISMSVFRSPAVALMPDVTVKPLRSRANAVINLMGTFGGICVLVLGMGFAFNNSAISNTFRPYIGFFAAVAGIMAVSLLVFMLFVKEPEWSAEMQEQSALLEEAEPVRDDASGDSGESEADGKKKKKKNRLGKAETVSLIFILASVALWYFGYNAVTSKYSVYATNVLDIDYSTTLLIANAAAIVSYLPVGMISSRFGRKKTILAGVVMLAAAFGIASFMKVGSSAVIMNIMFALAGIGWATINVNSFPMVVELSKNGDIGKYTGYYYSASMAAQAFTPFLSGMFMDRFGMTALFPYATVFCILAFVTMLFVRHGDSKPEAPKSNLEAIGSAEN